MVKGKQYRIWQRKAWRVWWPATMTVATCSFLGIIMLTIRIISNPHVSSSAVARKLIEDEAQQNHRGHIWMETVSWQPRIFRFHNFLSKEECEYIINEATPYMKKSQVVDMETGRSMDHRVRTSTGTFLPRGRGQIVKNIEKRIADFTFIPVENGESLQVLHYEVGQKYDPHFDFFGDRFNMENGGNRLATMLMYLSDVEEGGETVFPNIKGNFSSLPWWNELSDCGKKGLSVKPKMGDAVLFWDMHLNATLDIGTLHGACPVIKGNKWASVKWMHVLEYDSP